MRGVCGDNPKANKERDKMTKYEERTKREKGLAEEKKKERKRKNAESKIQRERERGYHLSVVCSDL